MIPLLFEQFVQLKSWFLPDRPGRLLALHAIHTGIGRFYGDRWPNPRVLLVESGGNYSLAGDAEALDPADLRGRISGFVDAPRSFVPLLRESFPQMIEWERIILALDDKLRVALPCAYPLRRLTASDRRLLAAMNEEMSWISKTWNGPEGLASSGLAWAALDGEQIISAACSFFVGDSYEDIGVVTDPAYRRQGLSAACSRALCQDIFTRGRRPSWSTSPDNQASLGVAEKLGFQFARYDTLYVVKQLVPDSPRAQSKLN